uniref:uncharacterized protein LOC120333435 n=1 Tax=Styela clava TaxID=7725 RepID=UPI00193AC7ED|nr:uncharacterized protein LOC120333435 [Styela clava]
MYSIVSILCLLVISDFSLGDGQNRYLSCSQLNSFCMESGSSVGDLEPSPSHFQQGCRQGKAGAKGDKGDTGPTGPSVEIDYDGLERRILNKVKEMIINCRVVYNDSCFVLVGARGNKYSKQDLERKCERIGGKLANLYNEEHRVKVSQYIRSLLGVYAEVALGMTYNPQENTFRLTSGEIVHIQFNWHPTYPLKDQIHQNGMLSVQPDAGSASQGFYNYKPYPRSFGLCEYRI